MLPSSMTIRFKASSRKENWEKKFSIEKERKSEEKERKKI